MRKLFVLMLVTVAAAFAAPMFASGNDTAKPSPDSDVNGPACRDITDADGFYTADGTVSNVVIFLAAASCKNVTYTLYVLDSNGVELATSSARGDGTGTADGGTVSIPSVQVDPVANPTILIYFTSSIGKGNVLDRAPDAGNSPPVGINTGFGYAGFH